MTIFFFFPERKIVFSHLKQICTTRFMSHVCLCRCQTAALWRWCPNRPHPTTSPPQPAFPAPPSADTVSQSKRASSVQAPVLCLASVGTVQTTHILGNYGCARWLTQQLISCKCNHVVSQAYQNVFCTRRFRYEQSQFLSPQSNGQLCLELLSFLLPRAFFFCNPFLFPTVCAVVCLQLWSKLCWMV